MARLKCVAIGCSVITDRRRAPATCPDSNRCEFEECDGGSAPVAVAPLPASNILTAPAPGPVAHPLLVTIGTHTWPVTATLILGRNGDLDVESFREHLGVSRRHCQLSRAAAVWIVTALSESSPTQLDGQTIPAGTQVVLTGPAHTLMLGGSMQIQLALPSAVDTSAELAPPAEPFLGALDEFFRN